MWGARWRFLLRPLWWLDQPEAGLAAARRSVALHRRLTAVNARYEPDLAWALEVAAGLLRNLGRRAEAIEMLRESAGLRRAWYHRGHAESIAYADTIGLLGDLLWESGDRDEALEQTKLLRHAYHEMTDTDSARPMLAATDAVLASRQADLGQVDEAVFHLREAIATAREHLDRDPSGQKHLDRDAPGREHFDRGASGRSQTEALLATVLERLSLLLSGAEALALVQESVAIRRQLALDQPDPFRPLLGAALSNLANRWLSLDQLDAALAAITEALEIYRSLPRHAADIARCLRVLSTVDQMLGRPADATAAIAESVSIGRRLVEEDPTQHAVEFGKTLMVYALQLRRRAEWRQSLVAAQEAIELLDGSPGAVLSAGEHSVCWESIALAYAHLGAADQAAAALLRLLDLANSEPGDEELRKFVADVMAAVARINAGDSPVSGGS